MCLLVQALDKSKYKDGLRSVRKYIPKLQQDLALLQVQAKSKPASITDAVEETQETDIEGTDSESYSNFQQENSDKLKEIADGSTQCTEDEDSEDLSDIFETDSETETEEHAEPPLYLEEFEKFPVRNYKEPEHFEDHLSQISFDSKKAKLTGEDVDLQNFDEVDRLFLRAASRLKNNRR